MPRLNHSTYSNQRQHLRDIWYFSGGFLCLLPKNNGIYITLSRYPGDDQR